MDFIDYSAKSVCKTPTLSVTASTSSPKTLYQVHTDLIFINVGSGWVPMAQPSSSSVYSGYTTLPASTQANVVTSLAVTAPLGSVTVKTGNAIDTAIRGHK
jgi:hypothetical protein